MSLQTMYEGVVNSPATTITNDINSTDTTIYLLDPTNVPTELPNLMVLGTGANAETVKVLSIDGSSIEVERGFQGTARSWNSGTVIARNFTEYDYATMIANIKLLESAENITYDNSDSGLTATDVQAAIDEIDAAVDTNTSDISTLDTEIGDLTTLTTTDKSSIVNAINEIDATLVAHKAENTTKRILATRDLSIAGIQEIELGIISKGLIIHCNVDLVAYKTAIAYVDKMGNVSTLSDYNQQSGLKLVTDKLYFYDSVGDSTVGSISISGTKLVINWTKTGAGATGTVGIIVMAFNHGE
jgi:hypothetical protein